MIKNFFGRWESDYKNKSNIFGQNNWSYRSRNRWTDNTSEFDPFMLNMYLFFHLQSCRDFAPQLFDIPKNFPFLKRQAIRHVLQDSVGHIPRSSLPEVFLVKSVLKICSKFTVKHPCRGMISIKLQSILRTHSKKHLV